MPSAKPKKRNPLLVGVYAEIPKSLYEKFREKYPAKGALRNLVIAVVKAAVKEETDE